MIARSDWCSRKSFLSHKLSHPCFSPPDFWLQVHRINSRPGRSCRLAVFSLTSNDIRPGTTIEFENAPWRVTGDLPNPRSSSPFLILSDLCTACLSHTSASCKQPISVRNGNCWGCTQGMFGAHTHLFVKRQEGNTQQHPSEQSACKLSPIT